MNNKPALPTLPKSAFHIPGIGGNLFTAEQMHEYALATLAQPKDQPAQPKEQKTQSFAEKYPRNPDVKCKCEHWEVCVDCYPTFVNAGVKGDV